MLNKMFTPLWRRILLGTIFWIVFWPVLWFFRIGEITGPKAWFWIVGELNYPFALLVFLLSDALLLRMKLKPWWVFFGSVFVVTLFMLVFYARGGFSFGVLAEAFLF